MSTAIRVNSLTLGGDGPRTLPGMEAHGKREDQTSQARRVRDTPPLVHGSLELRQAFDAHVAGARTNRGLKRPVLHAIVQYPTDLELTPERERWMLDEAVAFVDRTYGGRAVFAARLDRDEQGRHTVDVFAAPRYEKRTKRGSQDWISTTKHGKELCLRHRAEIERRHGGAFRDGPRQVGIALQSEWRAHLEAAARDAGLDLDLEPRREKAARGPDRLEPEQYQDVQDARRRAAEIGLQARRQAEAYAAALDGIRAGRLVPSPHPGEWVRRDRVSQGRLSSRADRLLDRPWSPDEWVDLCRVWEAIAKARAAAEAMAETERTREAAELAAAQAERRSAAAEAAVTAAQASAEATVRDAEQRRDQALAEVARVREAARTEAAQVAALTCAVEVVSSELVRPAPEPGKWVQGRRWDQGRWGEVRRRLAVPWTTPAWTVVRTVAGRVAALAEREARQAARFRRHAELIQGWVGTIADRLGLATADPREIAAAVAELDEPADELPPPSPFDDGPGP